MIFSAPFLAGALGSVFTSESIPTWYAQLDKPSFNPPAWVFGPVWTALYLMMGWSCYRIWSAVAKERDKRMALVAYWIQLGLNALWTPLFFGLKSPEAALAVIAILWLMIILTIRLFGKIDKKAAFLLLPYLGWVSFASLLNGAIAYLN